MSRKMQVVKLSMLFTLVFVLSCGLFSVNAMAETSHESIRINNTTLTFNKVYYVDANVGNDAAGDGSLNKPLRSLVKAASLCANSGDAIFIKGNLTDQYVTVGVKTFTIIGDYLKYGSALTGFRLITINDHIYKRPYGKVTLYNLKLKGTQTSGWSECLAVIDATLYNCVFEENCAYSDVYGNYEFNNCVISKVTNLRYGNTSFKNCVFLNNNPGSTTNCIFNAALDSMYNITSTGWKNTGAGTNPDGSKANIGVYGGEFAWGYTAPEPSITPTPAATATPTPAATATPASTPTPIPTTIPVLSPGEIHVNASNLTDLSVTIGDNTLNSITNGTGTLISNVDYKVSGNTVTISKLYLKYYFTKFPGQNLYLHFNFTSGNNSVLTVYTGDTPHVAIADTLSYKSDSGDAELSLMPNGNFITSVKNGDSPLIPRIDFTYAPSTNTFIIRKGYLNSFFSKLSTPLTLTVSFTGDAPKTVTINLIK